MKKLNVTVIKPRTSWSWAKLTTVGKAIFREQAFSTYSKNPWSVSPSQNQQNLISEDIECYKSSSEKGCVFESRLVRFWHLLEKAEKICSCFFVTSWIFFWLRLTRSQIFWRPSWKKTGFEKNHFLRVTLSLFWEPLSHFLIVSLLLYHLLRVTLSHSLTFLTLQSFLAISVSWDCHFFQSQKNVWHLFSLHFRSLSSTTSSLSSLPSSSTSTADTNRVRITNFRSEICAATKLFIFWFWSVSGRSSRWRLPSRSLDRHLALMKGGFNYQRKLVSLLIHNCEAIFSTSGPLIKAIFSR